MQKILVVAAALAASASPALAQRAVRGPAPIGVVNVVGVATVQAVPNVAKLTLSFTDIAPAANVVPLAGVSAEVRQADLAAVQRAHLARVAPQLEAARALVSDKERTRRRDVKATQRPSIVSEWETEATEGGRQRNVQVYRGQQITTTIQLTLRGSQKEIEAKLAKLFDSSVIAPDSVSDPEFSLSDSRRRSAERSALKRATKDARSQALAQLQPGERLGAAIQRGEVFDSNPRSQGVAKLAAARAETAAMSDAGGGEGIAQTGTKPVSKATAVVFEVLPAAGAARRASRSGK